MLARVDASGAALLVNEAAELIGRYPDVRADEVDRLVAIFPKLPVIDVALMISDDRLGPRVDSFTRKERARLRTPPSHLMALLSPVFLALIVAAWMLLR